MKHFRINNIHTNLGFFNLKRFLRKNNQFFYTSLNGIVSPWMVFTTWRQADRKNSCLGYESLVLTRQSLTFNSVELGIPEVLTSFRFSVLSRNDFLEEDFTFKWFVSQMRGASFLSGWGCPMGGISLDGGFQKNCRIGGALWVPPPLPPSPPGILGNHALPHNDPENQNFEKNETNSWRHYPFIHKCVP